MEPLTIDETLSYLEKIENTRELAQWMRGEFAEAHAAHLAATQRGDAEAAHRASARDAALGDWLNGLASQLASGE